MSAAVVVHDGFGRVIRENQTTRHNKITGAGGGRSQKITPKRAVTLSDTRSTTVETGKKPLSLIRETDLYYFYLTSRPGVNTPNFGTLAS